MADEYEVVDYGRGDPGFVHPEYKRASIHYALAVFGVILMASQMGITLGKIPASYWPLTVVAFIGGLTSYIWIYFSMEHLASAPDGVSKPLRSMATEGSIPDETLKTGLSGQRETTQSLKQRGPYDSH